LEKELLGKNPLNKQNKEEQSNTFHFKGTLALESGYFPRQVRFQIVTFEFHPCVVLVSCIFKVSKQIKSTLVTVVN
jgi:hypothetical protein